MNVKLFAIFFITGTAAFSIREDYTNSSKVCNELCVVCQGVGFINKDVCECAVKETDVNKKCLASAKEKAQAQDLGWKIVHPSEQRIEYPTPLMMEQLIPKRRVKRMPILHFVRLERSPYIGGNSHYQFIDNHPQVAMQKRVENNVDDYYVRVEDPSKGYSFTQGHQGGALFPQVHENTKDKSLSSPHGPTNHHLVPNPNKADDDVYDLVLDDFPGGYRVLVEDRPSYEIEQQLLYQSMDTIEPCPNDSSEVQKQTPKPSVDFGFEEECSQESTGKGASENRSLSGEGNEDDSGEGTFIGNSSAKEEESRTSKNGILLDSLGSPEKDEITLSEEDWEGVENHEDSEEQHKRDNLLWNDERVDYVTASMAEVPLKWEKADNSFESYNL